MIEYGDLRVTVVEAKSTVRLGEPFEFTVRLSNTSDRSMDLNLSLNSIPKKNMSYSGVNQFSVGNIEPGKHKDVRLTVIPVKTGLVTISNLQLTDLKRTYEFEDFIQVFVLDKHDNGDQYEMDKFVRYSSEAISLIK